MPPQQLQQQRPRHLSPQLSLRSVWTAVRPYKEYLALILVPYFFLVLIFHTQLTVHNEEKATDLQDVDGVNSIFAAGSQHARASLARDSDLGTFDETLRVNSHRNRNRPQFLHDDDDDDDTNTDTSHQGDTLRFSPHQRKNLQVALPPDNGGGDPGDDRRIPIPQITADQLGSKARNLGAPPADTRWQQHEQHHQQQRDSVAVYQIDWDTQSNYGDEVVDPELQDKQDNRIELTWKQSRWVSNNKTANKGTHDGIMMEHCLRNNGEWEETAEEGKEAEESATRGNHTTEGGRLSLPDQSRFQSILKNFAYTAFYDDRDRKKAYVQILLLLKGADHQSPLYCHFPITQQQPVNSSLEGTKSKSQKKRPKYLTTEVGFYQMCENHDERYGGWIGRCEVPSVLGRSPPCQVTLSIHRVYPLKHNLQSDRDKSLTIPLFALQNPRVKPLNFGVCVPPLFGYIPTTTLIEFIELTKLLGAQHLTFYAHQTPREVQKVLHYYEDKGDITVINWDLPVTNKEVWYHGQLLAINDCLNRNMHKFHYLAFNDLDEFIVPHHEKHLNWTDMMRDIANASQDTPMDLHAGYVFQSAFFDPLMDLNTRGLYDLESDLRTKAFSKVRTKVLVHSKRIYEVGIHHISKPVREHYRAIYIEPQVAFLHHYRKCTTDFDARMNCQVFARDESLSRYIPTLRHNVHQVLWTLKEEDKKVLGDVFV